MSIQRENGIKNGNTICNIAGPMIESIDDLTQEGSLAALY